MARRDCPSGQGLAVCLNEANHRNEEGVVVPLSRLKNQLRRRLSSDHEAQPTAPPAVGDQQEGPPSKPGLVEPIEGASIAESGDETSINHPPGSGSISSTSPGTEPQPPPLPTRTDPVPPMQPFPDCHPVVVVDGIPRKHAGRTASILNKTRLFYEREGTETTILVVDYSSQLDDLAHSMRLNGELAEGVRLVNLFDYIPDGSPPEAAPLNHEIAEPGLYPIADKDGRVHRFFDDAGVYRLYKRFDYAGRLLHRDLFNENRSRTRRDEYRLDGSIARSAFMDPDSNRPRQDIYYRRDGTPLINVWFTAEPVNQEPQVQRVTYFDAQGKPERAGTSFNKFLHGCLDELLGDRPTVLSVEARRVDDLILTYHRPSVRKSFVLHNAHISPPYDDVTRIRPSFARIMAAHTEPDALIFLTNTQRAEAEQLYGQQENFRVIPHSAHQPPDPVDPVERDPNLVIMMARLNYQKRVGHAISAFARVLKRHPEARLEIYGRGPELPELRARIARLKVQDSVKLMGFTDDPSSVYRRASLCIMTSRFEGAPLTVLESFMHGCPVISYDLKYGPPDMITDGVNGFLVPFGSIAKMADRIVEVLSDDELRASLSEGTATAAESYSEASFVARWSGLFNELAGAKDASDAT